MSKWPIFVTIRLNKQRHVDDTPYGGGAGMLLQAQPIYDALDAIAAKNDGLGKVILLDPVGRKFDQKLLKNYHKKNIWPLFVAIMKVMMSGSENELQMRSH